MSKKTILMSAPVKTRSGYGDHSRDLAYAIIKSGKYDLQIHPTNWGETAWTGLDTSTKEGKAIAECVVDTVDDLNKEQPDIFIQITIPNEFMPVGKFNIGITAGIETNLCKPEWIAGANKMDMVIGSSNHSLDVLKLTEYTQRDKKTNQPVGKVKLRSDLDLRVLFEGYDENVFNTTKTLDATIKNRLDSIDEDFCFLFVGHWLQGELGQDRKDVGMLIKTFYESFKNKSKKNQPALILKTSGANFSYLDEHQIHSRVLQIAHSIARKDKQITDINNLPSVYVIHGQLTQDQLNSVYNHNKVKAMVSFTKGEGFGRPLLEFGTTGKPIVASAWSGQVDFLDPTYTTLLQGELTPVHESVVNDWFMKEAKWFTVDYEFAKKALRNIHSNYSKFLKASKKQKTYIRKRFTLSKMQQEFLDILDTIKIKEPEAPKLPKLKLPKLHKKQQDKSLTLGGQSIPSTKGIKSIKLPKLKKQ